MSVIETLFSTCSILCEFVEVDRDRCSGEPVLRGTRFPVSRLLAEVAEGKDSLSTIAEEYDLDKKKVLAFFEVLSLFWGTPLAEKQHIREFRAAMLRPRDFHNLPQKEQWKIDRSLGTLDWHGCLTDEEEEIYWGAHDRPKTDF
jgi:uncharacterized protein (DUF433 family)